MDKEAMTYIYNGILLSHVKNEIMRFAATQEKAMAPPSSTLAWKILWTEEPGRLQAMESLRVRHELGTSLSLFTFLHWRRKWQPTPVFLPGEFQGQGSLVSCCLWDHTESDVTEVTQQQQQQHRWIQRLSYCSKSDRERRISYDITCMWDLKK